MKKLLCVMLLLATSVDCIKAEEIMKENTLDGEAGKVFDINMKARRFRFLKQNAQPDPDTGERPAWFEVAFTDATQFVRCEERKNLRGLTEPVTARFLGVDAECKKAMDAGELFRAERVILRPDITDPSTLPAGEDALVGRFTPREAKFSRDGILEVDGKKVPAGVKRGGIRITIEQAVTEQELANGVWKATLAGERQGDIFVASQLRLEPLTDRQATDDPKLPRVLSVGDSISINYEPSTRENLKGIANYHRIEDNCWSTERGVAFMQYWLGDFEREGHGWDVILFNSGMHDMKQKKLGGEYAVPLERYKQNLRTEIELMKKTGATLVFVTTTPVPNDGGSDRYAYRSQGAEKDFNRAALELLKDYPEIRILDLAKVVHDSAVMDKWRTGTDVHYWKEEEQAVLGKAVAEAVKKAIAGRDETNQYPSGPTP